MNPAKRGWALLCALLLLLFTLLPALPVRAGAASPSYDILSMDVALELSADRTAKVRETLEVSLCKRPALPLL